MCARFSKNSTFHHVAKSSFLDCFFFFLYFSCIWEKMNFSGVNFNLVSLVFSFVFIYSVQVRTEATLALTCDHLVANVMDADTSPSPRLEHAFGGQPPYTLEVWLYVWNRLRAMRVEYKLQGILTRGSGSAVGVYEQMARCVRAWVLTNRSTPSYVYRVESLKCKEKCMFHVGTFVEFVFPVSLFCLSF